VVNLKFAAVPPESSCELQVRRTSVEWTGQGKANPVARNKKGVVSVLFLKSIVIGLAVAAPIGPIGLLCIQAALARGWVAGCWIGLSAALADGALAGVAAFGLAVVMPWLIDHQGWVGLFGAIIMTVIGIGLIRKPPESDAQQAASGLRMHAGRFLGVFGMTVSNPMTALGFVGIFAGIGISVADSGLEPVILVLGVFLGSMLWWAFLSALASLGHGRLNTSTRAWINRGSGAVVLILAALAAGKSALWLAGMG